MPHTKVNLPWGDLGMELAPAFKQGQAATGCVISGWRNSPPVKNITLGSRIISVDGEYVENLSFGETIERIKRSTERTILLESPFKESADKENSSPRASSNRVRPISIEVKSIKKSPTVNRLTGKTTPSTPSSSRPLESSVHTPLADTPNTTINKLRQEHRKKDGILLMLQGQNAAAVHKLQASQDESKKLEQQLIAHQQELMIAKNEVVSVKGEKRDCDGQILLLKYQLDRIKSRYTAPCVANDPPSTPAQKKVNEARERADWLTHWSKFRAPLQHIDGNKKCNSLPPQDTQPTLSRPEVISVDAAQQCEDVSNSDIQCDLMVQQRLSHRLEMQLRCWVDGQIELHKKLAAEEGLVEFKKSQTTQKSSNESVQQKKTHELPQERHLQSNTGSILPVASTMMSVSPEKGPVLSSSASTKTQTSSPCKVSRQMVNTGQQSSVCSRHASFQTSPQVNQFSSSEKQKQQQREQYSINKREISSQQTVPPAPFPITSQSGMFTASPSPYNTINSQRHHVMYSQSTMSNSASHRKDMWTQSSAGKHRVEHVKHQSPNSSVLSPQLYRNIQSSLPDHQKENVSSGKSMYRSSVTSHSPHAASKIDNVYTSTDTADKSDRSALYTNPPLASTTNISTSTTLRSRSARSSALRDQMKKLKMESESIRGDLMKFRCTMREVRDECSHTQSRIFR